MPRRLRVVLCWHMHQPEYRDCRTGVERLPWVYLHAIKDYVDMAAHLEAVPGARAVVNFAPVLLEQIEAAATGLRAHLDHGAPLASPLLALLPADVVTRTDGVAPSTASAPSPPPPVAEPGPREWHVGQRVRHARYGTGTITAIAGDTIDCDFGKLGARAFPRALCPLT